MYYIVRSYSSSTLITRNVNTLITTTQMCRTCVRRELILVVFQFQFCWKHVPQLLTSLEQVAIVENFLEHRFRVISETFQTTPCAQLLFCDTLPYPSFLRFSPWLSECQVMLSLWDRKILCPLLFTLQLRVVLKFLKIAQRGKLCRKAWYPPSISQRHTGANHWGRWSSIWISSDAFWKHSAWHGCYQQL